MALDALLNVIQVPGPGVLSGLAWERQTLERGFHHLEMWQQISG